MFRPIGRATCKFMSANFYRRTLPSVCVDFSSSKGQQVFKNALDGGYMNAYFKLGPQLRTQDEPAYCGLSSLVIVLNALAIDPGRVWKGIWRWYHEEMLECCTSLDNIQINGTTLQQLSCIAQCNQLESKIVYADEELTVECLRNEIKSACRSAENALIVSFGRKILGQTGSGHFAPIGGYSMEDDLVLLLEPARFKYPPFWISVPLLLEAMKSVDPVTGKCRGYMILKESSHQPTLLFHLSKALNVIRPVGEDFVSFINEALSFLKLKVAEDIAVEDIMQNALLKFYDLSSEYKEAGRSLFFKTTEHHHVDKLSPEHQLAIGLLVDGIEKTDIYQLVLEQNQFLVNCVRSEGQSSMEVNEIMCGSTTCVLCFPHYLTLILFMLPLFSPKSQKSTQFMISEEEFTGSYMERIIELVEKVLNDLLKTLERYEEGSHVSGEDAEEDRHYKASKLLLNEIDQLQTQMRHILSVGIQHTCCGIASRN